ncbi:MULTISPECIES: S-layer homology domain-containing protein [Clostridium]|uniref:S-layer homology domain-containing protein n=1 Tax=Clostridium frigoriphilum TaxID=443253 RepID=A0ABU7UUA0_9CLOT|nr:S-layer homology domain-containing protein [Clostridium sp. DSM 17811]
MKKLSTITKGLICAFLFTLIIIPNNAFASTSIKNVTAINGKVTVIFNGVTATPKVTDFVLVQSIGNTNLKTVKVAKVTMDVTKKIATLTVPIVAKTSVGQSVVFRMSYKNGTKVIAPAFVVAKEVIAEVPAIYNTTVSRDLIYANVPSYTGKNIAESDRPIADGVQKMLGIELDTGYRGRNNWMNLKETWELNNFPQLRATMDKAFGTTVNVKDKSLGVNTKKGILYAGGRDAVLSSMLRRENFQTAIQQPDVKEALRTAASQAYTDITGDEWYAPYAALETYFGLTAGKEEGIYGANEPISRAEFSVLLDRSNTRASAIYVTNADYLAEDIGLEYYTPYVKNTQDAVLMNTNFGLDKSNITKPMSRLEGIYAVTNFVYTDAVLEINSSEAPVKTSYFKDTKNGGDIYLKYKGNVDTALKYEIANKVMDSTDVKVLNLAAEKGIVEADSKGNSNWYNVMTRAEAIKMIVDGIMGGSL